MSTVNLRELCVWCRCYVGLDSMMCDTCQNIPLPSSKGIPGTREDHLRFQKEVSNRKNIGEVKLALLHAAFVWR